MCSSLLPLPKALLGKLCGHVFPHQQSAFTVTEFYGFHRSDTSVRAEFPQHLQILDLTPNFILCVENNLSTFPRFAYPTILVKNQKGIFVSREKRSIVDFISENTCGYLRELTYDGSPGRRRLYVRSTNACHKSKCHVCQDTQQISTRRVFGITDSGELYVPTNAAQEMRVVHPTKPLAFPNLPPEVPHLLDSAHFRATTSVINGVTVKVCVNSHSHPEHVWTFTFPDVSFSPSIVQSFGPELEKTLLVGITRKNYPTHLYKFKIPDSTTSTQLNPPQELHLKKHIKLVGTTWQRGVCVARGKHPKLIECIQ